MIYFLEAPALGLVKIGKAVDVAARMQGLGELIPVKTRLLKVLPGYTKEESALHEWFAFHRVKGEWFRSAGVLPWLAGQSGVRDVAFDGSCQYCGHAHPRRSSALPQACVSRALNLPVTVVGRLVEAGALLSSCCPSGPVLRHSMVTLQANPDALQDVILVHTDRCGETTLSGTFCRNKRPCNVHRGGPAAKWAANLAGAPEGGGQAMP